MTQSKLPSLSLSPSIARRMRPSGKLRAASTAVLLTSVMAWGAAAHAGPLALDLGAALNGGAGAVVAAGPAVGVGVGAGVNGGVGVGTVGVGAGGGANTGGTLGGGTVNRALGVDTAVRAGANGNVTAEERAAAMRAATTGSAGVGVQVDGAANTTGMANRASGMADSVKGTVKATGGKVRQTAQGVAGRATGAVQGAGRVDANADVKASGSAAGDVISR